MFDNKGGDLTWSMKICAADIQALIYLDEYQGYTNITVTLLHKLFNGGKLFFLSYT